MRLPSSSFLICSTARWSKRIISVNFVILSLFSLGGPSSRAWTALPRSRRAATRGDSAQICRKDEVRLPPRPTCSGGSLHCCMQSRRCTSHGYAGAAAFCARAGLSGLHLPLQAVGCYSHPEHVPTNLPACCRIDLAVLPNEMCCEAIRVIGAVPPSGWLRRFSHRGQRWLTPIPHRL